MEGFAKGMLAGMILGAGAAAVLQPLDRGDIKRMKCRMTKAVKKTSDAMDHMMH